MLKPFKEERSSNNISTLGSKLILVWKELEMSVSCDEAAQRQ